MKIVVVNGFPRSGKDTFVNCCSRYLDNKCLNISTVDFVKELAAECGWDGTKTLKNRKFLSDLKDLLTEWDDIPYKKVEQSINVFCKANEIFNNTKIVAFIHCREPQEIQKFKDRMGAVTLLIRRAAVENDEHSNSADSNVLDYKYDYEIDNDGTLGELAIKARDFIDQLFI